MIRFKTETGAITESLLLTAKEKPPQKIVVPTKKLSKEEKPKDRKS